MPGVILGVVLGMAVGVGAYTFVYARGYSYMTDNAEACVNCHVSRTSLAAGLSQAIAQSPFATIATRLPDWSTSMQLKRATDSGIPTISPPVGLKTTFTVYVAYKQLGGGDIFKGFEALNKTLYLEARKSVTHPVACIDCHDSQTMQLRVTRPAFIEGMRALKASRAFRTTT